MKKRILLILLLIGLLAAACSPKAAAPSPAPPLVFAVRDGGYAEAGYGGEDASLTLSPVALPEAGKGVASNLEARLIIKNADLGIVVSDVQAKLTAIARLAERYDGFVLSSNLYKVSTSRGGIAPQAEISIRIPAGKFESAIAEVKEDAVDVTQDNQYGQDVTSEYVDLQSRLKARQAAAARLEQLLQQAQDTEAVLDIFRELESINAEIETLKGQIKYYEEASAYSLIKVTIVAEETIQPIEVGKWKPKGTVYKAVQALIDFLQGFANFLIWLILFILPVLMVVLGPPTLIGWAIAAAVRRRKAKKLKAE